MQAIDAATLTWIVLISYNLLGGILLSWVSRNIDLKSTLSEKSPTAPPADGATGAVGAGGASTSFSRVVGAQGAVVLIAFYWVLGDVVLYKGVNAPGEVTELVNGMVGYLWAGASLFLPYAANQLGAAFRPTPPR